MLTIMEQVPPVDMLHPFRIASSPRRPHGVLHTVSNSLPQSHGGFRVSCSSLRSGSIKPENDRITKSEYKPQLLDDWFLSLFRNKMAKEAGWDSEKPGYDGLIEVANRLMLTGRTNSDTRDAAVRILRSLFPPLLLDLYKVLVSPLGGGKVAALMVGECVFVFVIPRNDGLRLVFSIGSVAIGDWQVVNQVIVSCVLYANSPLKCSCPAARVTAITCQWLMGTCTVNSVELPGGTLWESGVFVERCKYLEESKCVGICINTCKLPTQFKFGVLPPLPEDDSTLKEPCLEICPTAGRRREVASKSDVVYCPKA